MNKKIGRRPARWMLELAEINLDNTPTVVGYKDLCQIFGITFRSVEAFCSKLDLEKKYEARGAYAVRILKMKDLKEGAAKYIAKSSAE